jgi:hypothetical protein
METSGAVVPIRPAARFALAERLLERLDPPLQSIALDQLREDLQDDRRP